MRTRTWILVAFAAVIAVLAGVAVTPLSAGSREQVFEIPNGTWARRMAGNKVEILPNRIYLTLGLQDVLVLRNRDDVPQTFGPMLIMPGQTFRLPFERSAEYQFACTAHASGQMAIVVEENPATPWARIRWRVQDLLQRHQ